MEQNLVENRASVAEKINLYREDVLALVKYLSWLEKKSGENLFQTYVPDAATSGTLKVPVYDGTLLAFIKTAKGTHFMNKNYVYSYTRKRIQGPKDELRIIEEAQIMDIEVLGDILSRYVLKGMTKAVIWTDGVENGVFYALVKKLKYLIEYWTVPMGNL